MPLGNASPPVAVFQSRRGTTLSALRRQRSLPWTALVVVAVLSCSCGTSAKTASPANARPASRPAALKAPVTTAAMDGQYFKDLAEADPSLATYVNSDGNTALRALLTDGSAFCALLQQGGGIDNAMASLVIGARSVEAKTHLPSTVTTFNAIDAVSLLALCPSEVKLTPSADQARIKTLGERLAGETA